MEAWPRRAMIPPPGRPMLPSSICRIAAVRMFCTPSVCWSSRPSTRTRSCGPGRSCGSPRRRSRRTTPAALRTPAPPVPGVPGEMPPEHLQEAARVFQRLIPVAGQLPARRVIAAGLLVPAGEQPAEILGVAEVLRHQVTGEGGGPAAAEAGSQTGNGGRVSNAGLVLGLDRAKRGVELLHEVVSSLSRVALRGPRCPACGAAPASAVTAGPPAACSRPPSGIAGRGSPAGPGHPRSG